MPNFTDLIIDSQWGMPLLITFVVSIVALALLATLLQWLEVWCELLQEEAESQKPLSRVLPFTNRKKAKAHHGWHLPHL